MSEASVRSGFGAIEGQDAAIGVLERALERDRIAHAYLFEGPSGVGKEQAARALAAALLCPNARRDRSCACALCERIRAGIHPDVRIFRPRDEGDRNLPVEVVRTEILPFVRFAPFEASAACLIFPQADVSFPDQHEESANALLKTLEEPRQRITFVLLSERPDRLLTTVRSRCQRVRFRPLSAAVLDRILDRSGVAPALRPAAIALAQGSADRALAFATEERAQRLLELALRIDRAVTASKPGDLLDLAAEMAQSDQLEVELSALALFYRDVAHVALGNDPERLSFPEQRALLSQRAERLGARGAAERVAAIAETTDALDRNANPETALDALLFGFSN